MQRLASQNLTRLSIAVQAIGASVKIIKVGAVEKEIQEAIKNIGVSLESEEITISDKDLSHAMREAKIEPLPSSVWEKLPDFLKSAKSVYWNNEKPGIIYVVETEKGLGKFVVLPNYKVGKGAKATKNE